MATKVSIENNILKVDNGVKILYHNAAWCDMDFTATSVTIRNHGIANRSDQPTITVILFTDFQDGAGTPIATEALIATYLSDKIG